MVVDTFWLATVGRPRRTVAWANSLVVGSTFLLRVDAPGAGFRWEASGRGCEVLCWGLVDQVHRGGSPRPLPRRGWESARLGRCDTFRKSSGGWSRGRVISTLSGIIGKDSSRRPDAGRETAHNPG